MRYAFAALVFLSTAALAGHDKDHGTNPSQPGPSQSQGHVPGAIPQRHGGHDKGLPGVSNGVHRESERHHHHRGYDDWMYPYPPFPSTWPDPAYPYGNWYYPYPPPYVGNDASGDDQNSLHGMVVPGDLPMGQSRAYWFYCDAPDGYYPYVKTCTRPWASIPVSPPPPGAAKPLSFADWQWCEETKGFFPYVTACKEGFAPMPVTSPSGTTPEVANWYFCEDPKGYAPYVVQCKKDWRAVPAVPPPSVKITVKDEKK